VEGVCLVVGLGRSGCAVGALLRRRGLRTIGVDDAPRAKVEAAWAADGLADLAGAGFDEVHTDGAWDAALKAPITAVALSPGVPLEHPRLVALRAAGLPVLGELEWAARCYGGRSVAVTGTNGKSTVTAWIAHVLRAGGLDSQGMGNLGNPLALVADTLAPDAVPVIECSSFQLETIETYRPTVGVLLNLAPDHLDRYPDLASYYAAKQRLADHVAHDGTFVTWTECPEALAWRHPGARLLFGDPARGAVAWSRDDRLWLRLGEQDLPLVTISDLTVPASPPNLLNAAATVAAVVPFGLSSEAIAEGLRTFRGLSHRHQRVGRLGDVRFVDDTKGTNVHAVCAGLRGYPDTVVLIAGGSGKGEDYAPLREVMGQVRHLVNIGREGPAIARAVGDLVPTHRAESMDEAVRLAAELAAPRGTVLLSPACASFDMFRNYHERGLAFAAAARSLGAKEE
jgi:UDP-N-acetylmuramoylalanine--D-glutamate ligase